MPRLFYPAPSPYPLPYYHDNRELKHSTFFVSRTASRSELFCFVFFFLGIFSLLETISLKIWVKWLSLRAKCLLLVSVLGKKKNKTSLALKLSNGPIGTGGGLVELDCPGSDGGFGQWDLSAICHWVALVFYWWSFRDTVVAVKCFFSFCTLSIAKIKSEVESSYVCKGEGG